MQRNLIASSAMGRNGTYHFQNFKGALIKGILFHQESNVTLGHITCPHWHHIEFKLMSIVLPKSEVSLGRVEWLCRYRMVRKLLRCIAMGNVWVLMNFVKSS